MLKLTDRGAMQGVLSIKNVSLSFGTISAGIVCCFWGMFHTIESTHMDYLISELALNYMSKTNIWYQILGKVAFP